VTYETALLLVLSNPVAGREDEFDDWYEDHARQLVEHLDQLHSARRFRYSPGGATTEAPYAHLCLYEFAGGIDASRAAMSQFQEDRAKATREGRPFPAPLSDSMDTARTRSWWFLAAGPRSAEIDVGTDLTTTDETRERSSLTANAAARAHLERHGKP